MRQGSGTLPLSDTCILGWPFSLSIRAQWQAPKSARRRQKDSFYDSHPPNPLEPSLCL